ncbi:MAG: sugar ABC transporter permease, partial [Chloroflexi bacterium]
MAVAATRERPIRGRSLGSFSWDRFTPFFLIAPSIVLIAIFVYAFIGYTAFISTTKWYGIAPDYTSAGLTQYIDLFGLPRFQADVSNT